MNDNELRTVSDANYRRLMTEAYPSPKKDIRAAVMEQITAEAAQSGKKAKILTPAFRKHFVRYGSIAACFVLLVTLGFRVLPMMTKDAVMESTVNTSADTDGLYADEVLPETRAAASEGGSGTPKSKLTVSAPAAPAEEPAEEELQEEPVAVKTYSAALTDMVTEEVIPEEALEEAAPEAEEAPAAPEPEAPMLMMAPAPAAVVEEAPVEECAAEAEEIEECVVEESVEEHITADDAAAVSETNVLLQEFEFSLKLALSRETDADTYADWLTARGYTDVSSWDPAEFVRDFGISRDRFTELYTEVTAAFTGLHPEFDVPVCNFDELYPN